MISLIIPIVYFFSLGGRFKINFLFRKQKKFFIKDRKLEKKFQLKFIELIVSTSKISKQLLSNIEVVSINRLYKSVLV